MADSRTAPEGSRISAAAERSGTRGHRELSRRSLGPFPPSAAGSTPRRVIDIPITGPLLSIAMSVIAQAIADRQSEIDRLEAEIKGR